MSLNPGWLGNPPRKTGVPTMRTAAFIIVKLLVLFTPIIKEHLEEELHQYLDNLLDALNAFLDNIPSPRP
jgi:hypothetical protein